MVTGELSRILTLKLRGWGNYYRHNVAKQTFGYVDSEVFKALRRWSTRRHPNKGMKWVVRKYFLPEKSHQWYFQGVRDVNGLTTREYLCQLAQIPIKRHIKIRSEATPYDPVYADYWQSRKENQGKSRNSWYATMETAL